MGACNWVPINIPGVVLSHFVRYLYTDAAMLSRLAAAQLFSLYIAARQYTLGRLAGLCLRQLKLNINLDTVLPLLRASARAGPVALPVQDACKHFFLANY